MAPKKRSFKDAFESAFNTILDVHEKQLNHKNHRADLKIKALEKRIHNLQEQACNDKILADAIQVHDPRRMVNSERPRHVNIIPQTSSRLTSAVFKHMSTSTSHKSTPKFTIHQKNPLSSTTVKNKKK